ncbi:MAG: hypothetical protein JRH07_02430 [Deltaproteobacteria bacterium]|nr:hypothetical protein [Deltaproteobacteria bacterium]
MKFQINVYKPGRRPSIRIPHEPSPTRWIMLILLGAIGLIFLGFAYFYSGQILTLKRKIRADQKQIAILRQCMKEIETEENEQSELEALLAQVRTKRVLWTDKLVDLSRLVPEEIRLTGLSLETIEKRPDRKNPRKKVKETVLTINGQVLTKPGQESLDHIARLIMSLNEASTFSRDFEPLGLVYTQRVKTREREFMEFEVSARLHPASEKG